MADDSMGYNTAHHRNSSSGEFIFGDTVELQDLAFSAQQALNQVQDDDLVPIDPALQSYDHGNDSMMDTSPKAQHRDTVIFSVEALSHDAMEGVETSLNGQAAPVMEPISPGTAPNVFHIHTNGFTEDPQSPTSHRNGNLSVQFSPLTPSAQRSGWPGSSTRRSGQTQTPHRSNRKSHTPKTPSGRRRDSKESIKLEPKSEPKRATSSVLVDSEEDMASLALALQLQMEEHGLRRRSMV